MFFSFIVVYSRQTRCCFDDNLANIVVSELLKSVQNIVNRGNGYETRQSSLLYVFVLFFGLGPAQNTIVVYSVLRN